MRLIAVDPGLSGAVAIIVDGVPSKFFEMPTTQEASKKVVDFVKLSSLLSGADVIVVEQVGASPRQGVSSAFSFGGSFMGVRGVAAGLGIECHTISPQKWKTIYGLLKQPKDAARLKVIKMFPDLVDVFKLKKSVDTCDALLLGLAWLKLNRQGG